MKKIFLYIFAPLMIIAASRGFAQTASNADFNPFPQMEEDQKSTDDQTAAAPQQQSDDWPPANNEAQANSGGEHD